MYVLYLLWTALWAPAPLPQWTVHPLPFAYYSGETSRKPLPATMGGGIAVFDFDRDGQLDIFFTNGADLPKGRKRPNTLLRNLGQLRFEDVTSQTGLTGDDYSFGAAVSEEGLVVTGLRTLTLYRPQKDGKFTAVPLDNHGRWSVGAAWFDMDGDKDLDLFVVNYVQWNPATEQVCLVEGRPDFCHPRHYQPQPNALFRNDGNGVFTDVSDAAGISTHLGKGMGVAIADFDGDGRLDVFVTNDRMPAFFFHNRGGKFEERAFDLGIAVPGHGAPVSGMGVDAQDMDGDGKPDLIYTALRDETFPVYRNTSPKGFEEWTVQSGLARLTRQMAGWGVVIQDLDGDGLRDIAVARSDALSGQAAGSRKEPLSWFRNTGGGRYAVETLPVSAAMYRGIVAADFDRDGCPDLVASALNAPAVILRNPCVAGGKAAPRQALGSTALGYGSSYWERPKP